MRDINTFLVFKDTNDKSTKNVWWKCSTCGYEWKSVIKARVKGMVCPVCADRAVWEGYNDLATTDAELLKEWDYQKNKISPNAVSRRSYKRAWWICKYGHNWNSKICERSIEKIPCKICENEFKYLLCQLLVIYYAGQYRFKVRIDSDEAVGLSVETYIPELNLIIEHPDTRSNRSAVKKSICSLKGIDYFEIAETEPVAMANRIKEVLRKRHIFIRSDSGEDIQICRERFFAWKESRK